MKFLALGWCSLRAVLRRGLCGGVARRWGVGCALGLVCVVGRAEPVVSNVTSSQIAGTREVAITYTLADATALDGRFNVTVQASRDNGATWAPVTQVTGAVSGVAPGAGKQITWKAGVEWPGLLLPQVKVRLIADNGMALIPAGTYTMGSVVASIAGTDKSDGLGDAPAHAVTLSGFYLGKTETTYAEWVAVRTWARDAARGAGVYDFGATVGGGKGDRHPVQAVSWYDVVKWCNAKSEREGLTPVYYTNDAQTLGYRTGDVNVTAAQVKWGANGYRLPTEAEWEHAARGGMSGQRFPWGDRITHAEANYYSHTFWFAFDVSATRGYHPTYGGGTSPVGVFAANGYGLSDMAGNVFEWTWDWYGSYGNGAVTDPRGAVSGTNRVYRGGSWEIEAALARSADRNNYNHYNPDNRINNIGFRSARSLEAPGVPTSVSAVGGNGQAVVSFSAPSNAGSSVITGYTVKATLPSGEVMSATGASSPITVTGLVNGGLYTFTVAATNSGGTGAAAGASVAVQISDPGMVLIPAGTFTMGSVVASIAGADKSDGMTYATPHAVTLSAFYLGKTETTYADWVAVRTWAFDPARGAGAYDFGATVGAGKGDTHPVQTVSWYEVVKWCNAKSERAGLTPVYYTNDAQTLVYRTGNVNVTTAQVRWGANGYRLPTEAEWEYAARGGLSGQRFPWGDTITHVQANYYSSTSSAYDVSTTRGNHPTYGTGGEPYTSPVGVFAANGYGLSDMAGNVFEITWDVYGSYGSGAVTDPRGAESGTVRMSRGGGWIYGAAPARSADRYPLNPDYRMNYLGFRPARSSEAPGVPTSVSAVGGNGQAVVSFSAPSNVGGSVITGYTVKATLPSGEVMSATGASSPITFTGLVNGGLYTFTVAATNSGGTGAASAASVAVRLADPGMALIPGGTYTMGTDQNGFIDVTPRAVTLSAFYLAKTETTYAEWVAVRTWAIDPARGIGVYDFGATLGGGKGDTHPVQMVSWYDVVKWCNAKSERAGLTPVYYTNDAQAAGSVYRTGDVGITATQVKWGANGYRLPTEAEWEYAARGGLSGQFFPWGDTITHVQANYSSSASSYDVSTTRGYHPTYATGVTPYTSPVGVFAANGYGLSDMAGNVFEWIWDWYERYGSGAVTDPRGPAAGGPLRVVRGGSWGDGAYSARSAYRYNKTPDVRSDDFGFRPARSLVP